MRVKCKISLIFVYPTVMHLMQPETLSNPEQLFLIRNYRAVVIAREKPGL